MGLLLGFLGAQQAIGGDTVNLLDTSAQHQTDEPEDARARITVYKSGAKIGECWYEDGGEQKQNDVVVPEASIILYQMKWESLSGDDPNNTSVAKSTWQALSGVHFYTEWEQTTEGELIGSITVSIRKGVGVTLDTAVWDGDAIVENP